MWGQSPLHTYGEKMRNLETWNYYGDSRVINQMADTKNSISMEFLFEHLQEEGCGEPIYLEELPAGSDFDRWRGDNWEIEGNDAASYKYEKAVFLCYLKEKFPEDFEGIPSFKELCSKLDKEKFSFPVIKFPTKFEICSQCDGHGSHVNPSIDCGGITSSEWAEWDHEDQERYMSGGYDIPCTNKCDNGKVLISIYDKSPFGRWAMSILNEYNYRQQEYALERANELRWGC